MTPNFTANSHVKNISKLSYDVAVTCNFFFFLNILAVAILSHCHSILKPVVKKEMGMLT